MKNVHDNDEIRNRKMAQIHFFFEEFERDFLQACEPLSQRATF